jgi:hypothetical protein
MFAGSGMLVPAGPVTVAPGEINLNVKALKLNPAPVLVVTMEITEPTGNKEALGRTRVIVPADALPE